MREGAPGWGSGGGWSTGWLSGYGQQVERSTVEGGGVNPNAGGERVCREPCGAGREGLQGIRCAAWEQSTGTTWKAYGLRRASAREEESTGVNEGAKG